MSTDATARERERNEPNPEGERDSFFGFLAGIYAAALAAPAVAIGVALRVSTDPGVLFFTLLGTATVVAAGVGWVARRERLAVRLGGTRWAWAAVVLPFVYAAALLVGAEAETVSGAVVGISMLGMLVGLFAGLGLVAAAHNRHAKAVLADAEEFARFTASAPERDRRLVGWTVGGLFVAGVIGFVASVVLGSVAFRWLFQLLVPIGAGLYGTTTEREVAVTDAGLMVANPVHRTVRPWSVYESYSVDEKAIVVRRAGWSPWCVRDLRRDASEVADAGAVADALGTFLPRQEA